jgi:hypothetical protein
MANFLMPGGKQGSMIGAMSLKQLELPSVMDTSSADMAGEFYVPALAVSVGYDRGVGFFSSGWLRVVARGLGGKVSFR